MKTFPLANEKQPTMYIKRSAGRYLRRELSKRMKMTKEELDEWLKEERRNGYNNYFLKLYFEWKYVMRGKKFTFEDLLERKDENEFIEILNTIQDELGWHYTDIPYELKKTIKELEEKLIDNKSQYNSRENSYFWSYE